MRRKNLQSFRVIFLANEPYLKLALRPLKLAERDQELGDDLLLPVKRHEHRIDRQVGRVGQRLRGKFERAR